MRQAGTPAGWVGIVAQVLRGASGERTRGCATSAARDSAIDIYLRSKYCTRELTRRVDRVRGRSGLAVRGVRISAALGRAYLPDALTFSAR